MRKIIHILIWLVISLLTGAMSNYFFHLDFWLSSFIAGIALIANGLIAEWEDRKTM
ncbi:hypothetical protein [Nitrosomonas sp. PY1]|uniref:hypothetical protein n=1 Tax=Nitrosomonas sp. PY1 TaxID=1803906 RepID=UPI001FC801EF|nr:hypothetical protein [Nitrosomonas sp. PY1]